MRRTHQHVALVLAILISLPGLVFGAAKKPVTLAELALYKGTDRQQILEEGARKEGRVSLYTSGTQAVNPVSEAFEKKYPFLKVETWRASSGPLISRTVEEFKSGRHAFDVMEGTQNNMMVLQGLGIVQAFYVPNLSDMEEEGMTPAPSGGVYAAALRSHGIGFGYNTKLLTKTQLPKTYQDLLDPRWKGKLALAASDTGPNWAGAIYHQYGEELLKKIAAQDFAAHTVSALTLLDMVVNGEYAASPTIFDSAVFGRKQKGAPVAWVPLEPVRVNVGQVALAKHAPHPYAALLFADFKISRESAVIHRSLGYDNFRKDVLPVEQRYKKYFGQDSIEEVREEHDLFNRLFLKK